MKDPAFLFYPGDYLRDIQCLTEPVQVVYDRIMCEHMRNICITHVQLNFFTKSLSGSEIEQLKQVLKETPEGFQIEWIAESISKRRAYSESRRKNRKSKTTNSDSNTNNISSTYDKHMENEIEIEDVNVIEKGKEGMGEKPTVLLPYTSAEFATQWQLWKNYRHKEHRQNYHSPESEQAALAELNSLAQGQQTNAIAILHQSMGKGWKGLFELKPQGNAGKPPAGKSKVKYSDDFKRKIAQRLQSG